MAKKQIRIVESSTQGLGLAYKVVIDSETGVNYLIVTAANAGGGCAVTLMVDKDGKPLVTPIDPAE